MKRNYKRPDVRIVGTHNLLMAAHALVVFSRNLCKNTSKINQLAISTREISERGQKSPSSGLKKKSFRAHFGETFFKPRRAVSNGCLTYDYVVE